MGDTQIQNRFPFTTTTEAIAHGDGHGHAHDHPQPQERPPSPEDDPEVMYWDRRTEGIANLLIRKGYFTADGVRREIERIEARTPMLGARVVAKAWTDPAFKARLLKDAKAACTELGIDVSAVNHLTVLENTERVHHAVVCTLCSCYPRPLLGEPPWWYKSTAYRNRVVVSPRRVLAESFGTTLPEDIELRVVDSTADSRFLVLPRRPAGSEGWSQEDLMKLVTRDSMVGVSEVLSPAEVAR
jgi:nitrile hydratase